MRSSFTSLLAIVLCIPVTLGAPSLPTTHRVKETVNAPRHWTKHGVPSPDHNIVLRIGLLQSNFLELERHLYEVSDPDHERYGKHLSKEDVDALVAPHQDSIDSVDSWLASHGIQESDVTRSSAKDWVTIKVPIRVAEEMLGTTYDIWKHMETGDTAIRTTSYSLPHHLHEHIELIQPTTLFGGLKASRVNRAHERCDTAVQHKRADSDQPPIHDPVSGSTVDASCNTNITISCLLQLYNAVDYQASATSGNSIAVTGYINQYANIQDLQQFYAEQRPDAVGSSFAFVSIRGGKNSQNLSEAGGEAALDTQFAFGLTYPTPATFYSTASRPPEEIDPEHPDEAYLYWLDFMVAHNDLQYTISTSYGDDEQIIPESWARRGCAQFAQLGARGVSILFASGDVGVADTTTQMCRTIDGTNVTRFQPFFPASCPYVTAVGATQSIPEVAVTTYASGGGFSNLFPRPSYQDKAVQAYLATLPSGLYEGLYNPNGRAYPDVSAQGGENFGVIVRGAPFPIAGGTSASTPTFAGIVALLNDARLSAGGLPALGFLNPLLYSRGIAGLNDVTVGNNPGCGTPGFNASEGWDPVTGLGTPNFGKLKDIVLS